MVAGLGASGSHVARQLSMVGIALHLHDIDGKRQARVVAASGKRARGGPLPTPASGDVAVLATPAGNHVAMAGRLLDRGAHVVSISDDPDDVEGLLDLDNRARERGRSLVVGAGFAPGMSCLLARHAANDLDVVDEIAVAKAGTGGPACARQHHRALKQPGAMWVEGAWVTRRGGSGRDLAWFPGSIGARDCYQAALPSPRLLQRSFPDARRLSARVTATRRDRFTSPLPMLRKPHADGGPGAIRVEVRGRRGGSIETIVFGVMDHPSVATGTVAGLCALGLAGRSIALASDGPVGHWPTGAYGLSELPDPVPLLRALHERGVRAATM